MTEWYYHCSHCGEPLIPDQHSNKYSDNHKFDHLYEFECPICRHIDIFAKDVSSNKPNKSPRVVQQ